MDIKKSEQLSLDPHKKVAGFIKFVKDVKCLDCELGVPDVREYFL